MVEFPEYLRERLANIKLLAMDVDGVLTDGGMYYSEHGDELKKFNTRDGKAIELLRNAGIKTAFITRERTRLVERRAAKLRIDELYQGIEDKLAALQQVISSYGLTLISMILMLCRRLAWQSLLLMVCQRTETWHTTLPKPKEERALSEK